ncbi:MAG: hypothetical protein NT033_04715 [Candidatus Omnitrophica bacterium]|nr:hypothetical protein [Candidatus Omnitrophota bacterium]
MLNRLPEVNRFLRGLRAWVGFKQAGVPYARPERKFGRTTNSFLKNLRWAQKAVFSFSYAPLDFIAWLALFVVGMSFIGIIFQAASRIFFPGTVPSGFTTLIILILFMGGIQLLCLSIIGSYLMHIYDEVKRRPPYIIDSILNAPSQETGQETREKVQRF